MQNEIKQLCQQYGIRPSKAKGQNFLINKNVLAKIVKSADLSKSDYVLEVGAGFGVLTEALVKASKKVLTVELDKGLVYFLKQKFKSIKNLIIVQDDILRIKNSDLVGNLSRPWRDAASGGKSKKYKVVANLPYAITKPIFKKFLSYDPKPQMMVVLVQKEVAQKIVAKPGKMSVLSLSIQFYGQPEIIEYVSRKNFYPQPKVDSAILKIKIRQSLPLEMQKLKQFEEKKFWQVVKIGFSSPRKQLQNNLVAGLKLAKNEVINKLKLAGLKPEIRAQNLSLADWANIYQQFVV